MNMKYSELYRLLESKGWKKANGTNHYKFRNPEFKYFIIVPRHASHEVPIGTLRSILRQARLI